MGIIKDFLDSIKDIKSMTGGMSITKPTITSLSRESAHGTLQFPILVSQNLDIETSQMVSKALEKEFASFVQITMSMNTVFNFDGKNSETIIKDFLRKFHQNTDTNITMFDVTKKLLESATLESINDGSGLILSIITSGGDFRILKENLEQLKDPFADININIVNNIVKEQKEYFINKDKVSDEFSEKYSGVMEAKGPKISKSDKGYQLPSDSLKWTQVQKFNELMPTHLIIKIKAMGDSPGKEMDLEFVIGVKSIMHPIKSEEMIANVVAACKNDSKIFSFIKWTTGEISFFKDFLLNLNEIKDDVVNRSSGASSWWIMLKRRKTLAKVKKFMFIPNNILPNATIVMTMEEVNYIKSEYGYDLMKPYFIESIMKAYFLLGFVIVDSSTQTVHLMFDGQDNYQTYTFSGLQKEADSKEDFKQMLKVINRI
jgi:hypothetical protein